MKNDNLINGPINGPQAGWAPDYTSEKPNPMFELGAMLGGKNDELITLKAENARLQAELKHAVMLIERKPPSFVVDALTKSLQEENARLSAELEAVKKELETQPLKPAAKIIEEHIYLTEENKALTSELKEFSKEIEQLKAQLAESQLALKDAREALEDAEDRVERFANALAHNWIPISCTPRKGEIIDLWIKDEAEGFRLTDITWGKETHCSHYEYGENCDCGIDPNWEGWIDNLGRKIEEGENATHWKMLTIPDKPFPIVKAREALSKQQPETGRVGAVVQAAKAWFKNCKKKWELPPTAWRNFPMRGVTQYREDPEKSTEYDLYVAVEALQALEGGV